MDSRKLAQLCRELADNKKAEDIIRGQSVDGKLAAQAAEAAVEGAKPLTMNEYKVEITKALVRRTLLA
jgi:xanthine dehydrogenase YagS FAD-binding subunit